MMRIKSILKTKKRYIKKLPKSASYSIDNLVSNIKKKTLKIHDLYTDKFVTLYKIDNLHNDQIQKLVLQVHRLISKINSYPLQQKARSMQNSHLDVEPINPNLVPVVNRDFIQIKLIEILVLLNHKYKEINNEINKKNRAAANLIIDNSNQIQGLIKRFGSIGAFIIIPSSHI